MTTTAYQAARAEALRILGARIERVSATPATTGQVIRLGRHLYLHADGYLAGVEVARVYHDANMAERISGSMMNGLGEHGQTVPHTTALHDELEHLNAMRDQIASIGAAA